MPSVRKTTKPKPTIRKRRYNRRSKKSLVSLIKKVSLGTQETKMATQRASAQVFHNGGVGSSGKPMLMFENCLKTTQGLSDGTNLAHRVGDCITPVGVKLYMEFDQPSDRSNVNFKVFIVKIRSHSVQTALPMKAISSNIIMDPVDTEYCQIVATRTYKYGDNYFTGDVNKFTCFFRKSWIKLPKFQYVYKSDNDQLGRDYQLAVYVGAYDTSGTLLTDVIGSVSFNCALYFKDA